MNVDIGAQVSKLEIPEMRGKSFWRSDWRGRVFQDVYLIEGWTEAGKHWLRENMPATAERVGEAYLAKMVYGSYRVGHVHLSAIREAALAAGLRPGF